MLCASCHPAGLPVTGLQEAKPPARGFLATRPLDQKTRYAPLRPAFYTSCFFAGSGRVVAALSKQHKQENTTMSMTLIPLSKLRVSSRNVRKTETQDFADLKASIAMTGLLNNLHVIEVGKGKKTTYEVVAGGRRLAALLALAEEGTIAADFEVKCHIVQEDTATEVSLAENAIRRNMHPADQFLAFRQLSEEGKSPADIAARFGVSDHTVLQRLKLAAVSPVLFETYRKGEMTLEQLMAFTVNEDMATQEAVWESIGQNAHYSPNSIRRALTETRLLAHDPMVQFVGEADYLAAGGVITRDLFSEEAYFDSPDIVRKLVTEKLTAFAEPLKGEGWKWIEADLHDKLDISDYGRIRGEAAALSEDEEARIAELEAEQEAISEAYENGELDEEEGGEQQEALEAQIDAIRDKAPLYKAEDKARAGVLIRMKRSSGKIFAIYGLVRQEDRTVGEVEADQPSHSNKPKKPRISAKLLEELTAHRSRALAYTLTEQPETALTALLHTLTARMGDMRYYSEKCLKMGNLEAVSYHKYETVQGSLAHLALEEKTEEWAALMPQGDAERWQWLEQLDDAQRKSLLGFCVSQFVDTISYPIPAGHAITRKTPLLAQFVPVDMTQFWEPTAENYFSRIGKSQIAAAVEQVAGEREAWHVEAKKKQDAVTYAARLLAGKGWLPPELRTEEAEAEIMPDAEEERAESEDSPMFDEEALPQEEAAA
jgi:ParB family chromosome partitioning protein